MRSLLILLLALTGQISAEPTPAPLVVASILPIHSLVAGVMSGVGEPLLLVPGGQSPHHYHLRPSAARALQQALLVIWLGPEIEPFLARPLRSSPSPALPLLDAPEIHLLALGDSAEGHRHDGWRDGHVWLDPQNAIQITHLVARNLVETDPPRSAQYLQNADALIDRLEALDVELQAALAPVRNRPFLVFHDAYRYLAEHYRLNLVAAVTVDPDRPPGVKRVLEMRKLILASGAHCVFSSPQLRSGLMDTLLEGTGAQRGVLDPLGRDIPPGPGAYFSLMRNLGRQLTACLTQEGKPTR